MTTWIQDSFKVTITAKFGICINEYTDNWYRIQSPEKNHTNYLIFDRGCRELNGKKRKKKDNNNVSIHCVVALDINRPQNK